MFNQKGVFNDVKSIVSISGENGTLIKTINVPLMMDYMQLIWVMVG